MQVLLLLALIGAIANGPCYAMTVKGEEFGHANVAEEKEENRERIGTIKFNAGPSMHGSKKGMHGSRADVDLKGLEMDTVNIQGHDGCDFVGARAGHSWHGMQQEGYGSANFVEHNGHLVGSVTCNGIVFSLNTIGDEIHVEAINANDFPAEDDVEDLDSLLLEFHQQETKSAADISHVKSAADNGDVLDVMVVYTNAAMCTESGQASGCADTPRNRAPIEARIDLAVQETNDAFQDSGVLTRLRLVHQYLDSSYNDLGVSFSTLLTDLRQKGDGRLDSVHAARDQYGADFVVLITDNTQYCGLGYLLETDSWYNEQLAFSVTSRRCATGYYSFGHEIAHNLGCNHDRNTARASSTTTKKNFGYQHPQGWYRSVMAYNCPGVSCPRMQYFSTTKMKLNNQHAIGSEKDDNVAQINARRFSAAQYRPSVSDEPEPECYSDSDCDDDDACNGSETCDAGVCKPGLELVCSNSHACMISSCVPLVGCIEIRDEDCCMSDDDCDDGNACNGAEICNDAGGCTPGDDLECPTSNDCMQALCDPDMGCYEEEIDGCCLTDDECDDGDMCNGEEVCRAGMCTPGEAPTCTPSHYCTWSWCDPQIGCREVDISGCCLSDEDCDDGDACNGEEVCRSGKCRAGEELSCSSSNDCVSGSCDAEVGCVYVELHDCCTSDDQCDDGNVCNGEETCNGGECVDGLYLDCGSSSNVCEINSCDPSGGCIVEHIPNCCVADDDCDDGDDCNGADYCDTETNLCAVGSAHCGSWHWWSNWRNLV